MKKIFFSLILAVTALFTSCDMDKQPYGYLDDNTAIESENDLRQFRNNLYSSMRTVTSGSWLYAQDIQMDEFHGLISNANRYGVFSNALIVSSTDYMESYWYSCYTVIATCNAVISYAESMSASESFDEDDKTEFSRYKAEAQFVRAYMYFWLADHYCQPYTRTDPDAEASGMPIQLTYNPTGDVTAYPSRSTLTETFTQIEKDLSDAYDGLKAYETSGGSEVSEMLTPNASYLSSYAVEALQARVALVKGDWQTARDKAVDVIGSGVYTLTNISNFETLWSDDEGDEVIFRPFMSSTELGGSNGEEYISDTETTADYIPTYETLIGYSEGDVRFDVYFKVYNNLEVEGQSYAAYVLNKFPGNTALRTGSTNNIMNMSKPFRLSEMYLIAAEAEGRLGSTNGNNYLNELRSNRISGYRSQSYTAQTLIEETLTERKLELIGEGLRMSDIRRTGSGFTRYSTHDENPSLDAVIVEAGRSMSYTSDDYRLTWPIPTAEMDANPNLKGQQNPGY